MITFEEARARAHARVAELAQTLHIELAIDDAATRVMPWCWVFFYNSRAYLETRRLSDALAGNGPLVVESASGTMHELTAAQPLEDQLEALHDAAGPSPGAGEQGIDR